MSYRPSWAWSFPLYRQRSYCDTECETIITTISQSVNSATIHNPRHESEALRDYAEWSAKWLCEEMSVQSLAELTVCTDSPYRTLVGRLFQQQRWQANVPCTVAHHGRLDSRLALDIRCLIPLRFKFCTKIALRGLVLSRNSITLFRSTACTHPMHLHLSSSSSSSERHLLQWLRAVECCCVYGQSPLGVTTFSLPSAVNWAAVCRHSLHIDTRKLYRYAGQFQLPVHVCHLSVCCRAK